ncbi:MAG: type II toxin-antitoxin system RelE/ParE family toxin [Candidatus Omnitrophica bacterium]|nr:type II toxin-antitoxin system RelE/ParE family toxin [Candidatus Omnitrophota bacterium]
MFKIQFFKDVKRKSPFREWLNSLSIKARDRVLSRLYRIQNGNLGDYKRIGTGVFKLRLFFDGGWRIYFGRDGEEIILLLCGGDKSSQKRDIEKALEYWRQYHEQKKD